MLPGRDFGAFSLLSEGYSSLPFVSAFKLEPNQRLAIEDGRGSEKGNTRIGEGGILLK